ncbi:hypothetical protein BC936DRAFT_137196 [Jimgerdemannia flammicorona]|uniref:Uncharacterized protein n=1 Tax=Jimgerdemannia flammicorona TaxID=994334 RepID=A0A433DJ53_9FUNG|nr:hypothetical protein BC936DRAFT_137196 [Jimgerdemannia flammicorona]
MHPLPKCINALQYRSFWESTDEPSLNKFLYYRFSAGNLQEEDTEHSRYTAELNVIGKYYDEASEVGQKLQKWKKAFKASIMFLRISST